MRLNNRGVALMSQQQTGKAEESFAAARKVDPKLARAAINDGIALMTLQKLDEAKAALRQAIEVDPKSAAAWYNLGLAQHAGNEMEDALKSFLEAAKIDPNDADSFYFAGACYQELRRYEESIAVLKKALEIDPLHASAEFGLARALQREGKTDEAKEHFKRFQHLTNAKISAAIGLAYGEQGRLSLVMPVELGATKPAAMIPVTLTAETIRGAKSTGGACMMDATGAGQMDLVVMQAGPQAIAVLHKGADGAWQPIDAEAAGLKAAGRAVACAVGDYDGDGLNDLAVALDDQVLLFKNLGKGKFQDVTAEAGLGARNRPTGITFVDYDHDGDLDLLLTGAPLECGWGIERPLAE